MLGFFVFFSGFDRKRLELMELMVSLVLGLDSLFVIMIFFYFSGVHVGVITFFLLFFFKLRTI